VKIHPYAWLVWLSSVLVILSVGRNPIYLLLVLLVLIIVYHHVIKFSEIQHRFIRPWPFAIIVLLTTTLFNTLTVHLGTTVFFHLPQQLPLLGGPLTLEALFYGLFNGLILIMIFMAFSIINLALPARTLIRLIPRAFYPITLVITIALTFIPATLQQFEQIREAQAVRGHQWRGIRDSLPLLIPLFIGGLERALQLAEAITARGFRTQSSYDMKTQIVMLFSLVLLLTGGLLRLVWSYPTSGMIIILMGLSIMAIRLKIVGQRVPYTQYHPHPWRYLDGLIIISALMVLTIFLFDIPQWDQSSIFYSPYPTITMPEINPIIALMTLVLVIPVWRVYFIKRLP